MRIVRCLFVGFLLTGLSLAGCGFLDQQLVRDPATGESKLEAEVKTAEPFIPAPWGQIALAAAGLVTSVYGAFHAREANKQTDKNNNGVPDDQEKV